MTDRPITQADFDAAAQPYAPPPAEAPLPSLRQIGFWAAICLAVTLIFAASF